MRGHLQADDDYQERLIRFIENHDEPRAAATFAPAKARAAAVVMSTLQGARLYHDGQFDGARTHMPVFLGARPGRTARRRSAGVLSAPAARGRRVAAARGRLARCASASGWPDNQSCRQLVAWCWSAGETRALVVVNLADAAAQARVQLTAWSDLAGRAWEVQDRLGGERFTRDGDELAGDGLYVELGGWEAYFLAFSPAAAAG